jgi:O-antigen ligase
MSVALDRFAEHPLVGVGAGRGAVETRSAAGRVLVQEYVHNEYVQVLLEYGVVGAALLAALIAAIARALWQRGARRREDPLWCGVAAACVAAPFDFVWHVPVVPLVLAVLIGLGVASAQRGGVGR